MVWRFKKYTCNIHHINELSKIVQLNCLWPRASPFSVKYTVQITCFKRIYGVTISQGCAESVPGLCTCNSYWVREDLCFVFRNADISFGNRSRASTLETGWNSSYVICYLCLYILEKLCLSVFNVTYVTH